MKKRFFKLFEECYLIFGKKGAAIYNLLTGNIYSLDKTEGNFLSKTETNTSIEDARISLGLPDETVNAFIKNLIENNLGSIYDEPVHIEKVTKEANWADKLFFKMPPQLNRAFIEITTECNNNCFFCNSPSLIRRFPCMGCKKSESEMELPLSKIFVLLEKLWALDCKKIIFTGGDVFLKWTRTKEILHKAVDLGFKNIAVIWGGDSVPPNIINELIQLNITLIIQRCVSSLSLDNDYFLGLLKDENQKLSYGLILVSDYAKKETAHLVANNISNFIKPKFLYLDFIVSKDFMPKEYLSELNIIPRTSVDDFAIKRKYHPCLGGTISFTANGGVIPCFGLRDCEVGIVENLFEIFDSKKIDQYWRLTKEKINGCADCQYKYACNDCRHVEYKLGKNLYGMYTCELAVAREETK